MQGERVVVTFPDGREREGVVEKLWSAPLHGASVVVDFNAFEYVIAPVANVRRHSESEAQA